MNAKLSSRDVKCFLLGVFSLFILDVIADWGENVESFKQGFRDGAGMEQVDKSED